MNTFDRFMDKVLEPLNPLLLDETITDNLSKWQQELVRAFQEAIITGKSLYIVHPRGLGKSIAQTVLDLQRELREPKPLPKREEDGFVPFAEWVRANGMPKEMGHIENFRFVQPPVIRDEFIDEPRAKNGTLPNRKTEQAKAKLPFYHKNRRF